ncbi:Cytochrome P450, E-class, group I [Parasponia andersonii]|uniref:Cytochrome P450, E-class, group I n=1 Tax=Parasponia andersonii TaxID=3476 RepID=A0A2P5DP41_PARAD|nr:Cytochrome P450, E-class, group I [Parasponia andersonii]
MEISSLNIQSALVLALLGLLLHHASSKILVQRKKKSKNIIINSVPEPSGSLPIIGHLHLLGGQVPVAKILGAMADKHGPIYSLRLGQHRALVLSSWELVTECFTTNDRLFANRPSIAVGKYLGYDSAAFAVSPYGQYWREVRKMATLQLLSTHRLESLRHVRVSEVDSFIKGLVPSPTHDDDHDHHVPLSELLEQLTFNINARLIVGKRFSASAMSFDEEASDEACRFKKAIKEALYLSGVFVVSDAVPWLEFLDIHGHVSAMKRTFKEIDIVLENWLEEHRRARDQCNNSTGNTTTSTIERDLMHVMLSSIEEDDPMLSGYSRDTVIKATAMILLLTGTESTAVTLTWAVSLLLNNPSVLKAAQEELDNHVGRDRWVQESDINNLKFLQAIVKETLRLYPPAPITGPREATEDCYVGGHHVPRGTRLIVNLWKLQRDPRVWPDPLEFRPGRFMTTNADLGFRGKNFEYIPFSSGRRSCPGMTLGLLVVQLVLARLVQGFDMKTKDNKPVDMREGLGIALPKLNSLEVVLAPRLPPQLY